MNMYGICFKNLKNEIDKNRVGYKNICVFNKKFIIHR